ncbi:MAG: ABC-2 transporter permease, partial [Micromonosporaceae bacterium]|nr:ABC-2 transporter permease [Micromonosporaceae bacterium]
ARDAGEPSMTHLAQFVRLDLMAMRPYLKSMVVMVAIVAVAVAATSREPLAVFPALMVMGAMFPSYPFSLDERAHLDALYATLPVSRTVVVLGRYVTLLIMFAGVVLAGLVTVAVLVLVGSGIAALVHLGGWTPPESFVDHPAPLCAAGGTVGVLALAVSITISRRVYAVRTL